MDIYGALNLGTDSERIFIQTLGQSVVYDAVNTVLNVYNQDIAAAMRVFIATQTSDFKIRYKLPGGGQLEELSKIGLPGERKAGGSWDVALPLKGYGAAIGASRIDYAYMTLRDLDLHMQSIQIRGLNTMRQQILYALLNNTERTFTDELHGDLLIEPLANGDGVYYPQVIGATDPATENHYLASGYTAANISDTNDPFPTIIDELEEHFGVTQGGSNIVVFINNAQTAKTLALTRVTAAAITNIKPGANISIADVLPAGLPGERTLGYHEKGCFIREWRSLPANYMLAVHLDAPAPLIERVDPPDVGLGNGGLQMVATDIDYPNTTSYYEQRFGLGVGNRLNGVVMQLTTNGTYAIPSGYA